MFIFIEKQYCDKPMKLNVEIRWNECNNPTKSLKPSKHFRSNIDHCFTYISISNAPINTKARRNLEPSYHTLWKPNLTKQKDFK